MPGETYSVAVVLQHPEMKRGGFQASARFADGERAGRQAGHWAASGEDDVRLDPDSSDAVYATHVEPSGQRGRAVWRFSWRAPREGERVVFHVAGNASNDDNSEFGDFIVLGSHEIMPIPAAARK